MIRSRTYKPILQPARLAVLCFVLALAACGPQATDYQRETAELKTRISQLEKSAGKDEALKLVYCRFQLAALSGNYGDFRAAEDSINGALQAHGPHDDLYYFSAHLHFKLHRFAASHESIELMHRAADSPDLRALRADLALQQGRYAEALRGYEQLLAEKKSWDTLARLAYYRLKTGHPEDADELYRQAADLIPATELRAYAWVELQRGLIDLEYARHGQALEHYRLADRAYSGYWLIEEHIAEALRLAGRTREAAALYRDIIARTRNPEFVTALANITEATDSAAAAELYREADTLYGEQFALYPEAAAGHLIEYLLAKQDPDPRLLEYAQWNHSLRPNAEAKLLLARAHLKLGATAKARGLVDEILQTPWRTPELQILMGETGMAGLENNTHDM